MTGSLFNIGVSALLSNQRVLGVVGHNIANVNSEGYTRQRVELVARPPQLLGGMHLGRGVETTRIGRVVDQFIDLQLRGNTSNHAHAQSLREFAAQLNDLLGDSSAGLQPALTGFFDSLQELTNDPSSIPTRQVLLRDAETLVAQFNEQGLQLERLSSGVNTQIEVDVAEVNLLADGIAALNRDIAEALGQTQGEPPNDLLDKRDAMILRLSELVQVRTLNQSDGSVNVMIGRGQALVVGVMTADLEVVRDSLDGMRAEVAYTVSGVQSVISGDLSGGRLGGVLAFRDDVLAPARNAVGRLAAGLAMTFNAEHRAGMDLSGNLGADFFVLPAPTTLADPANAGSIAVTFDPAAVGSLTTSDYTLRHDGAAFTLTRLSDGSTQTLSGAGPFNVDGLTITVTGAAAAGDSYRLEPLSRLAQQLSLAVTSATEIAAAAPIRARADLANLGTGRVSVGEVLNVGDPALLAPVVLVFGNPPNTYQINGVGPALPYTAGANVDLNGWRVQVSGAPLPGDRFMIEPNLGGAGDNRNARRLNALAETGIFDGGTADYQAAYGGLVGDVGSRMRQAEVNESALSALREHVENARSQVSGVNLDEEAANLLRFQQAYQAAARVIQSAQTTFDALMDAFR